MVDVLLAAEQRSLAEGPSGSRVFLEGIAGTGKTTTGLARLTYLLESGVPADSIAVLVPQRTLARPYFEALRRPHVPAGGAVNVATVGGIARRMIDLFWPLVAEEAGFAHPDARPSFLTLETSQYYMAHVVRPMIEEEGYFESITIDRNRLYSQILDNLNKSAVVGFPPTEIAVRLKGAWMGEQSQSRVYDEAQRCALRFRRYCLEHNLLDFSLQMTVFVEHLWEEPLCRDHLLKTYTNLIVDNVEEDTPVAHDVIYTWVGHARSALVIFDQEAGYRSFLGADPESARAIADLCDETVIFEHSYVAAADVVALTGAFASVLVPSSLIKGDDGSEVETPAATTVGIGRSVATVPVAAPRLSRDRLHRALHFEDRRFQPEMLDWVAEQVSRLVHVDGVPPREIVVLAPFLSDALRFSLSHRLRQRDVPVRSHRPSRALRDEPATQTLLTLAMIAHPGWGIVPTRHDVAHALMHGIADLDLVRAQLLGQFVYRPHDGQPALLSFDELGTALQQRITYALGERYEALRSKLTANADKVREEEPVPLDHYLARLFGELLSQPGYGFHQDLDAGRVAATLVESVQKFRQISPSELRAPARLGLEYVTMVREGVIAAQYLQAWQLERDDAVLLAPAYTFLLANRPVDCQIWLNIGGQGWWERLYQPLTHPYVLSRRWPIGKLWTDADEFALRQMTLYRQVLGLLRRCRRAVYLGLSEFSEQGYEQEGPLLRAVQRVLRQAT